MSSVLSFYFDGAIVQAVKVHITGTSVTISHARTFPFDELADYLSLCREKSCIVCCNPSFFYQDIVNLPPAASKLYDKLVRGELQNTHPDLTSFSIFHRTIGETMVDARPYSKIAAFSYPDDFLSDFITVVSRFGMSISQIFAAPYSIFRLAHASCTADPDKTRIFIATIPGEKLLLVSENNELEFIRKIPSFDSALLPEDAQNINMTVDYCFQTLRVRPCEAVMLNQSELSDVLSSLVSVPYRSVLPVQLKDLPSHIIQEYLAPVAAALHSVEAPGIGNILPADYAGFCLYKKLLAATALFMFVLTLLLAGYVVAERMIISELTSKISRMRTELSGSGGEIAAFRKLDAEVSLLKKPLDLISKHNSSLNPSTALAALALPETPGYTIKGITIQSGEAFVAVQIEGVINASGYSDTQASFEKLVSQLAAVSGYVLTSSSVDIKQKTFNIQARYNGGGPQVK